jgi:hypothetical protein
MAPPDRDAGKQCLAFRAYTAIFLKGSCLQSGKMSKPVHNFERGLVFNIY